MPARVILSANELGVFTKLTRPKTAAQLSAVLKTDLRATIILLDALTALTLLRKTDGVYANTPAAERLLLPGGANYQGNMLRHGSSMWDNWGALSEVMRTGEPARRSFDCEGFIMGMDDISRDRVPVVLKALTPYIKADSRVLDLGGGPGSYCIALANRGVKTTLFDLPETIAVARRNMRGKATGIQCIKGDFMHDPIGGKYDLILVSQICHAYSAEDNRALFAKCHAALNPGGRIAVQEVPLSEDRTQPTMGALFSVNMLVGTEGGMSYTPEEVTQWLQETGFGSIRRKDIRSETVLLIGQKTGGARGAGRAARGK